MIKVIKGDQGTSEEEFMEVKFQDLSINDGKRFSTHSCTC